jgi:hypothetical protein
MNLDTLILPKLVHWGLSILNNLNQSTKLTLPANQLIVLTSSIFSFAAASPRLS